MNRVIRIIFIVLVITGCSSADDEFIIFKPVSKGFLGNYKFEENVPKQEIENFVVVFREYGINYKVVNGVLSVKKLDIHNTELMKNYTTKARDPNWLKNHKKE